MAGIDNADFVQPARQLRPFLEAIWRIPERSGGADSAFVRRWEKCQHPRYSPWHGLSPGHDGRERCGRQQDHRGPRATRVFVQREFGPAEAAVVGV
jgi:hypothetical protein